MSRRRIAAAVAAVVYLSSVVLANWLTTHFGFVPVGFGETATAGTFAAGGALIVRDVLQDAVGRLGVLLCVGLAAALSYLVAAPQVAIASGAAFALAELLDMAIYTPLRKRARFGDRRWQLAVASGAAVGAVADTVVFLRLAFGWPAVWPSLPGQLAGKAEIVAALILLGVAGRALLREPLDREGA